MTRPTTWADVESGQCEARYWSSARLPDRRGIVWCPFCRAESRVYWRAFAGRGKRCPCGALLAADLYAYRRRDTLEGEGA